VARSPLEEYLPTVREDAHATVRVLVAAIEAAGAALDCKVTYKMLVFTFGQRWHQWVVAVGVSRSVVNLRFLYANELDDPAAILRIGSATAGQVDFRTAADVDAELVTAYVREAVERHPNKP
jgi:hypothetical protein